MLSTLTALLILCTSLAILLHQNNSQLPTPHLYILYTTAAFASTALLINIDAEPWAYLLAGAGSSLYATIRAFHRKYHGFTPNKNVQDRNNRRARRRER
jgi:hypothetical protein